MRYTDYLNSDHWQRWRAFILERDCNACQLCGETAGTLNVHHKVYRGWYNEVASDLVTLCEDCHGEYHRRHKQLSRRIKSASGLYKSFLAWRLSRWEDAINEL